MLLVVEIIIQKYNEQNRIIENVLEREIDDAFWTVYFRWCNSLCYIFYEVIMFIYIFALTWNFNIDILHSFPLCKKYQIKEIIELKFQPAI